VLVGGVCSWICAYQHFILFLVVDVGGCSSRVHVSGLRAFGRLGVFLCCEHLGGGRFVVEEVHTAPRERESTFGGAAQGGHVGERERERDRERERERERVSYESLPPRFFLRLAKSFFAKHCFANLAPCELER
jgi:hypothetical protein